MVKTIHEEEKEYPDLLVFFCFYVMEKEDAWQIQGGLNSRWISVVKKMVDLNDGKREVYLDRTI